MSETLGYLVLPAAATVLPFLLVVRRPRRKLAWRPFTWMAMGSGIGLGMGLFHMLVVVPKDQYEYEDVLLVLPLLCAVVGAVVGSAVGMVRLFRSR